MNRFLFRPGLSARLQNIVFIGCLALGSSPALGDTLMPLPVLRDPSLRSDPALPVAEKFEKRPIRLPPLFWYERDPEQRRRFVMVSMLYWDYREQTASHQLLLPVYYRWRDADRSLLVSLPFVVSYQRPDEKWLVAGLFYRHRDTEATRTALFPLYWQKIKPAGGRVTMALPFLFYDYRSFDRRRMDQVSVLGWARRRGDKHSGFQLNSWWAYDQEKGFRAVFPVYWKTWSPNSRLNVVAPFYWRWKVEADIDYAPPYSDKEGLKSRRAYAGLFPLVGAGWGDDYISHYVFPLYYYARSSRQHSIATLPFSSFRRKDSRKGHVGLYFYSHDPELRLDGIFPFWFHRRSADGFENKTQFLTYYGGQENGESFHTLFPLYGYWSSPEGSRLLSWGIWWRNSPAASSGWALLYRWKKTPEGDSTRVFFPLYWHFWRPPDWGVDVLFPVYMKYRDRDTTVTVVPPVLWRRAGDHTTWSALFLYWRDVEKHSGSTTLFPLFHDRYDAKRHLFFSPVTWLRRGPSSREGLVPPVYWFRSSETRRLIVFPLYWGTAAPEKGLTIVPPYYHWRKQDRVAYGIFPLWGRHHGDRERGSYLLPFYWHTGNGRGDGLWIIPPILTYVSKSGTGTENPRLYVQYLILGSVEKGRDRLNHDFFPLYKYISHGEDKNFWAPRIIALAAWERHGEFRKGYVFPYIWRRSPEKDWNLFIPLWYHSRVYDVTETTGSVRVRGAQSGGATTVIPLYWSGKNKEREYRYFIPLYAHYGEENRRFSLFTPLWISYDTVAGGKFRMFFPLYWRFHMIGSSSPVETKEALTGAGQTEKAVAAGPVVGTKGTKSQRDIVVLGPLYRVDSWKEGRRSRTVGLAPLFSRTYTGPDDKYFEILGGLWGRDVQQGRRRFRWFYFFYTTAKELPRRR